MLEFQRLSESDLDELLKVKINAFSDDKEIYGFGPPGYDDSDQLREGFKKYIIFKMVLDSKLIGGISCQDQGDGCFYLGGIYIDEDHQNLGIGTKAISFLEQEFTEAKVWHLETPYKSYRNHHFYEKLGYVKVGQTPPDMDAGGFYLFLYEKQMMPN